MVCREGRGLISANNSNRVLCNIPSILVFEHSLIITLSNYSTVDEANSMWILLLKKMCDLYSQD